VKHHAATKHDAKDNSLSFAPLAIRYYCASRARYIGSSLRNYSPAFVDEVSESVDSVLPGRSQISPVLAAWCRFARLPELKNTQRLDRLSAIVFLWSWRVYPLALVATPASKVAEEEKDTSPSLLVHARGAGSYEQTRPSSEPLNPS
jgi:hypothetical protein